MRDIKICRKCSELRFVEYAIEGETIRGFFCDKGIPYELIFGKWKSRNVMSLKQVNSFLFTPDVYVKFYKSKRKFKKMVMRRRYWTRLKSFDVPFTCKFKMEHMVLTDKPMV